MNYWLMKSEPDVFGIDDLKRMGRAPWDGVRNYQARNNMKTMKVGDLILFYHSSTEIPGVAGLAKVVREAYPDHSAWDKKSEYFDKKASPENPIWMMVDVEFVEKFPQVLSLDEMRTHPELEGLMVLRRGMRLSVQPVSASHFDAIVKLMSKSSAPLPS